jgi:hypothetical protein
MNGGARGSRCPHRDTENDEEHKELSHGRTSSLRETTKFEPAQEAMQAARRSPSGNAADWRTVGNVDDAVTDYGGLGKAKIVPPAPGPHQGRDD